MALALAHEPQVVFLDEPTAGLDVASRAELHKSVQDLHASKRTVILTTHDMAEAEKLCDRVAILLRGRVVAIGSPRELTAAHGGRTKISVRATGNSLSRAELADTAGYSWDGEYLVFFTAQPGPAVSSIIAYIEKSGDELIDLRVERPSLEERFLELTQGTEVPE